MKGDYPSNCVVAIEQTAVWSDIIRNSTVNATEAKDIRLKSTGNKKMRVSAYLTANAN